MLLLTGALTSKPYSFTSRPWELKSVQSIDIFDGIGSNIRIDFKESEIVRILPRKNFNVNDNWISDKIRFFYDGLKRQRLNSPYLKKSGELSSLKWEGTLSIVSSLFKVFSFEYGSSSIGILSGSTLSTEVLYVLRELAFNFGFFFAGLDRYLNIHMDHPSDYMFQIQIKDLESADYCLLVGTNPRFEASILNLRLRRIFRKGNFFVGSVGSLINTTFSIDYLGLSSFTLFEIAEGKHTVCKSLVKSKNPLIIYGSSLLSRFDFSGILNILKSISYIYFLLFSKYLSYNILHTDCNLVGGLELGIKPLKKDLLKSFKIIYGIGLCNSLIYEELQKNLYSSVLILQDSTGSSITSFADIVLPMTSFVEHSGIYYNVEGRPQKFQRAFIGPNLSRDTWKIINLLHETLYKSLKYTTKSQLGTQVSKLLPSFYFSDVWFLKSVPLAFCPVILDTILTEKVFNFSFKLLIEDFFMTSTLCNSSSIMAKASESLRSYSTNYRFLA